MKTLSNIITSALKSTHDLGEESHDITQEQVDEIRFELTQKIKQLSQRIKLLVLIIVVVILLLIVAIVAIPNTSKEELATYSTLIGISPVAIGSILLSLKKEYEQARILLHLVESISRENITSILTIFLSVLKK